MTNALQSTGFVPAVKSLGEIDDEKVSSMLANFFSTSWTKAKSGNVKAAIDLQHYADRAGQTGLDNPMTKAILQKMEPTAASKLEQAIATGSVISFD